VFVAVGLLVFIACVSVVAFYAGRGYVQPRATTMIDAPIDVPPAGDSPEVVVEQPPVAQPPSATTAEADRPKEDRDLAATLSQKVLEGRRIIDAVRDPRTKDAVITFAVESGEDEKTLCARIGASSLEAMTEAAKVTVRAVRAGRLTMVADLTREAVSHAGTAEWQSVNGTDLETWVDAVLTNVWREADRESPAPSP
jgi:hypothetical protein